MPNRRDFLKTAAFATLGSGIAVSQVLAGESIASTIHINKQGMGGKMKMTFFPYELKLRHVFTVATYSIWRGVNAPLSWGDGGVGDEFP